ncbi:MULTISPECIES: alpha/beta fold hydrolase [Streptomyces]|uniref:Pimeloyl-ACP methyl ester carboxylesterase n=2 Tax=Streptomyces TaxID=1883 RepID=A0ABT9L9G8_STRGD|nr:MULTISPECIES: alpha/beta hydrolase [Streptomyces]MDP9680340.1 pimeloyl-ACP methyl ester carboxylesterase [Streptomyces griseoviridis]GGT09295.1 alpha/beta hydrolase [Streptomyces griseoviridis]GGU52790.1 alpha/beta hydrolase [Streptomyces daghestanicus]GHI29142.1 alpha/beta hydrolase [Streptomyces daghestanicus]
MSPYLSDSVETRYVRGPLGERFAYRRFGRAVDVPLVLLTRLRATMDHWDPDFLDRLATRREIVVFDNRGTGASTGTPPASIDGLVEGALSFTRSLGLDEVDLLGWAMGGTVAQGMALAEPFLVRRLVLAGSSPGGIPRLPAQAVKVRQTLSKPVNDEEDFLYLFFPQTDPARAVGRASLGRLQRRLRASRTVVGPEAVRAQLVAVGTFEGFWERQSELDLPVLLAHGVRDVVVHPYASYAMAQRLPDAKVIFYNDAGHGFLFQHPDDFAVEVDHFLS